MKPGSRDKAYPVLISGTELAELKKLTWSMAEAFGLDRRIEEYKGQRPIGLYRWDLECLLEVIEMELHEMEARPGRASRKYLTLKALHDRLSELCAKAFADLEDHTR